MKLQKIPASQSNPKQKIDAGNITVLTSNCQSHSNNNSQYYTETNKPGKQNKEPRKESTKVSKRILLQPWSWGNTLSTAQERNSTCTKTNPEQIQDLSRKPETLHLIKHGQGKDANNAQNTR